MYLHEMYKRHTLIVLLCVCLEHCKSRFIGVLTPIHFPCKTDHRSRHLGVVDGVSFSNIMIYVLFRPTPVQKSADFQSHKTHKHPEHEKVRERSQRSVAMSRPSRSSLSASTPDSLSDNESNSIGGAGGPSSTGIGIGRYTPRKPSYTPSSARTGLTPGGSRNGSKPNSRPVSRAGSKPPSRHGSTLSLDSTGK